MPACGTEAQLALEATELEMTHTWGELLCPTLFSTHLPIPSPSVTSQPEGGQLHVQEQGIRLCLVPCKKHPLSIYHVPSSGLGTTVVQPFLELHRSQSGGKQVVSVPCDLCFYRGSHKRFGGTVEGWLNLDVLEAFLEEGPKLALNDLTEVIQASLAQDTVNTYPRSGGNCSGYKFKFI